MTTMTAGGRVPEFTLGWRLRLALDTGNISVNEMAQQLGYSRSTVSRWLNDQDPPRAAVMAQWALITGVDLGWLQEGMGITPPPPGPGKPASDKLARLTEQKQARTRGSRTTRQYVPNVLMPAVAA